MTPFCACESSLKAYLHEWGLEHRNAGLGQLDKKPEVERLRAVEVRQAKQERQERQARAVRGGNPRQLFVAQMDAARDRSGSKRSWAQFQAYKQEMARQWDESPK